LTPEPGDLVLAPAHVVIPSRPMRVLDFDVEARPLHWISSDYVSKEITAIAWAWTDTPDDVHCHLLGETDAVFMLTLFRWAYDYADMVTGHFIRCVVPETRVLTADLRWVCAGDLVPGDRLVAFDEHGAPRRGRRIRFAEVVSNEPRCERTYAVDLESGQTLYATAEHPWLVGTRNDRNAMRFHWRRTDELLGSSAIQPNRFARRPVWLYQVVDPWRSIDTREAGWLAGFFDGEGTLGRSGSAGQALQITAAQNPGPTLQYAVDALHRYGFVSAVVGRRSSAIRAQSLRVNGGINDALRFLGQVRPQRLLKRWVDYPSMQALRQIKMVRVVGLRDVGQREVAGLSTSTHTYIAEGFAVHNSYDLPVINGAMTEYGLPPLGDKLTQDTKLDFIRRQGLSNSQENIGAMLGLAHEKVKMNQQLWRDANRLTPSGLEATRARVVGDVQQHIEMRRRLLELGYLGPLVLWKGGATSLDTTYTP